MGGSRQQNHDPLAIQFSSKLHAPRQTQNICIPFVQRRPKVFDVGPTLQKCHTNILFAGTAPGN